LAGPLTLGAVAFFGEGEELSNDFGLGGIKDSKKLSHKRRVEWAMKITKQLPYAVSSIHAGEIDSGGISRALRKAVADVLEKLLTENPSIFHSECVVQLDGGLHAPDLFTHQETIIKGDETNALISAASIVAKVCRDAYMCRLHEKYPVYGFDKHKGYGTRLHMDNIIKHGLSRHHRKSFCRNFIK